MLFSIPDAWHTLGPAVVLTLAGPVHGVAARGGLCRGAAGGLRRRSRRLDRAGVLRAGDRAAAAGACDRARVADRRVHRAVGAAGRAGGARQPGRAAAGRAADRSAAARRARSQRRASPNPSSRLGLLARERTRLQAAVHRLGDAFAAKLDLGALTDVLLSGSIDALDADAGRLVHDPVGRRGRSSRPTVRPSSTALLQRCREARARNARRQPERGGRGLRAGACRLQFGTHGAGALAVARRGRAFREDEQALMLGLVERAQSAARRDPRARTCCATRR